VKRPYSIAAISFLVVILAVIAIYVYEKQETRALTAESGETNQADQFFGEMGITRVNPGAGPFDLGLQNLDGRIVNLSEYKGKIVFLNFWTTWCKSCRDEVSSMSKLHNKLKDRDFVMVALNLQERASVVKKFVREFELSFAVLLDSDGKAKALFGVGTIPTTFILDKEGKVIGTAVGSREWDSEKSIALFEHLISEGVAPAS
jgi:peroxiredoxin